MRACNCFLIPGSSAVGRSASPVSSSSNIPRGLEKLRHRTRRPQFLDRRVVVAGLAQNLVAVLADPGRMPRFYLLAAVDPDRAIDGQHGVALERHQHLVLEHLLVVRDIVEDADHAERQAIAVEYPAPLG